MWTLNTGLTSEELTKVGFKPLYLYKSNTFFDSDDNAISPKTNKKLWDSIKVYVPPMKNTRTDLNPMLFEIKTNNGVVFKLFRVIIPSRIKLALKNINKVKYPLLDHEIYYIFNKIRDHSGQGINRLTQRELDQFLCESGAVDRLALPKNKADRVEVVKIYNGLYNFKFKKTVLSDFELNEIESLYKKGFVRSQIAKILEIPYDLIPINNKEINYWTAEEIDILSKYLKIMTHEEIQKKFLPHRSIKAIGVKASLLGITDEKKTWTTEEIDILKSCVNIMSHKEIQKMLPNRSIESIEVKISQLKLAKTYRSEWTIEELNYLKKYRKLINNDAELKQKYLPNRTITAIKKKALQLKLSK